MNIDNLPTIHQTVDSFIMSISDDWPDDDGSDVWEDYPDEPSDDEVFWEDDYFDDDEEF